MDQNWNEKLLSFISASPTAFHACRNLAERLKEEGYEELSEQERIREEAELETAIAEERNREAIMDAEKELYEQFDKEELY